MKSEFSQIASEMSIPDIQAAMESALQSAAKSATEDFFSSGTLEKVRNDTVSRVTTMQSTYHGSYNATDTALNSSTILTTARDHGAGDSTINPKRPRTNRSKVCHRTSATGTLFGKVWVRTTTVKAEARAGSSKGTIDIVTSFIFYPSWWLTKIGLRQGMEANLSNSSDGWRFKFSPGRAVPDNSLIFEFCSQGNLRAVQHLIARGDASVRDTSSKGWTPLHVSITR